MKSLSVWSRDMRLFWDLHQLIKNGGSTPEERTEVAREFSVSEELMLRYERAASLYFPSIHDKQLRQARIEALRWLKAEGKDILTHNDEFWKKASEALERIQAEAPKDELTREFDAAEAALRAAVNASPGTPER